MDMNTFDLITISLMDISRPSSINMKRKGERGYISWLSWDGEKVLEGEPLIRTEKKSEVRERTHLIQEWENTKALRIC
jgi:hypothetical protein